MSGQRQPREAYSKPAVVKVSLAPAEMAVSTCKTRTGRGPTTGCFPPTCKKMGS